MNPLAYIKTLSHHAYFIHAFNGAVAKLKEHLMKTFGISHIKNPDFYHEKFETLGIDESRKIKENHQSKSFSKEGKRVFIIECSNITIEAQNSLLKIFEEPNENSHFFLVMPSSEILLPTLRSRVLIIKPGIDTDAEIVVSQSTIDAENFLKLSKKARVDFVDEIAKRISDEKANKSDAIEFLSSLETVVYKKGPEKNLKLLDSILKAREYMNDRSPSIKQLLEYVALNV